MTTPILFILGASDPEMEAIRGLIRDAHNQGAPISWQDATCLGARVHPGTAYKADPLPPALVAGIHPECRVILIECGGAALEDSLPEGRGSSIDHHRPGDHGWGAPPASYWDASSLGQVCDLLGIEPTAELRMTAAADHCLAAAYAGQCPGVDPNNLWGHRARERGLFVASLPDGHPVKEGVRHYLDGAADWVSAVCIARAESLKDLRSRPWVEIRHPGADYLLDMHPQARDLRDRVLPEAPEALARAGECGLYRLPKAPGTPDLIGIIGAGEGSVPGTAPVEAFMAAARMGVVAGSTVDPASVYGDPVRGFAGALAESPCVRCPAISEEECVEQRCPHRGDA